MPGDAERACRRARRLNLARMDLAVADAEGVEFIALGLRHRRGSERVEAAAEQHDGPPTALVLRVTHLIRVIRVIRGDVPIDPWR